MDTAKKMYKVLNPIPKKDGSTYWMRIGTAFTNRDNSINVVLDAIPPSHEQQYKFQIREMDAEDLRRRESYGPRGSSGHGSGGSSGGDADRYAVRDLGGIGGGPTTRAVTTSANDGDSIPF